MSSAKSLAAEPAVRKEKTFPRDIFTFSRAHRRNFPQTITNDTIEPAHRRSSQAVSLTAVPAQKTNEAHFCLKYSSSGLILFL